MNKFYPLLFLLLLGCRSAQKSYSKGDYADAIELGVKQLQKDPSDITTSQIIKDAYRFAVAARQEEIRALSNSSRDDRFARIYSQYQRLQDLYLTIQASPAAYAYVKPVSYSDYVETYRNKTIAVHTDRAAELLARGDKEAAKQAYTEYRSALRYAPNDRRLLRQRDSAYDAAVTRVVIVPLQQQMPYNYSASFQLQRFYDNVIRTLRQNLDDDFVRVYSEWEAQSNRVAPDQIMELALGRTFIGIPRDEVSRRNVSQRVVVKERVFKPDSVVKEYATVQATIQTTNRILYSEGELFISLRDAGGRILWTDRFMGEHQWQTRLVTYNGDERALSAEDRRQLNEQGQAAPREEEILEALFQRIQNDLAYRLRGYYTR